MTPAVPLPPVVQTFTVNAAEYLAGIDEMIAATERLAASITATAEAAGRMSGATAEAGAADAEYSAQADLMSSAIRDQALAIAQMSAAYDEEIGQIDALIGADDAYIASLAEVKGAQEEAAGGAGLFAGTGTAAFMAVGAGIAYGVVEAAKFQANITRLNTQAGVTKSQLGELSQGILTLASQVGFSPNSLSQALYHIESAFQSVGITGPKALSLLRIASEGAAVGHANLVDVTNALDATIVAGVPGIHNYSQAMGVLNAIVGTGDMTMQDLANAMGSGVMAVAKSYGQSIYQVGAALATFGDNNIRGAKAATDLRMTWQAILKPIATGDAALAHLGLTSTALGTTLTHQGLTAALQEFVSHLNASKVPVSDWGQYITEIFGKRAGVGIGILLDQLDRVKGKLPDLHKAAGDFGSAWTQTSKTLSQQWHNMLSGIEALAIHFGTILLPAVTKVVGEIAKFFGWLEKHPAFAAIAGGILAVAAAAGALALAFGAISAMASPEVLIAAALIGLGVAIYEAYKHCAEFRRIIEDVANFFKSAWNDAVHIAGDVIKWFTDGPLAFIKQQIGVFSKFWQQNHAEIEKIAKVVWDVISTVIKTAWDIIQGVLKSGLDMLKAIWTAVWDTIRTVVKTVWDVIATVVRDGIHMVLDVISIVLDIIQGHWSAAWAKLKDLISTAWHEMISVTKTILDGFITILFDIGKNLIQGLINGIKSMFGAVVSAAESVGKGVLGALKDVLKIFSPSQEAVQIGLMFGAGLVQGLEGSASQVNSAASKLATIIKDAVSGGLISDSEGLSLTRSIESTNTRLQALATQRATILKTITTAEKYATTTTQNVESWASLSNAVSGLPQGGGISGAGLLTSLQTDLATIKQFNAAIKKLADLGLNKTLLDQIIQAGPTDGLQIAQALLDGPVSTIKQISQTEKQIVSASTSIGQVAANAMYDTGKNAGRGFLKGLEDQQKAIEKLMAKIADAMISRLKKDLGISSPSTVAHWHGLMFAQGLANGLDDGSGLVDAAMHRLTGPMQSAKIPALSSLGGGGATGDTHINIDVHVDNGFIGSDAQFLAALAPVVQKALLQLEGRNPLAQTTLPRR